MIYVYALTEPPCGPNPGVMGLDGQCVATSEVGGIRVVYSRHHRSAVAEPSAENLWTHERVVESCMADGRGAVLPIRFGAKLADENGVARVLASHVGTIKAGFDRVRDCVELGVRILGLPEARPPDPPAELTSNRPPATGRDYMMARLVTERHRRGDEVRAARVAREVQEALLPLAREAVLNVRGGPELLATAAYLVPRGGEETFADRVRELAAKQPALRLLCTGPWPAYHFAPSLPAAELPHA